MSVSPLTNKMRRSVNIRSQWHVPTKNKGTRVGLSTRRGDGVNDGDLPKTRHQLGELSYRGGSTSRASPKLPLDKNTEKVNKDCHLISRPQEIIGLKNLFM